MNPDYLPNPHRIGFHYYPDLWHYRQADLETWLPRLAELGASWLTLLAPLERAIPEGFIHGLLSAGVQPLLHFCLQPGKPAPLETLRLLLGAYARWGVQYVAFYERPNARDSWAASAWVQNSLVERFLDEFIPLAWAAQERGLSVITSPLEPGGDYWDLAFLRTMLRGLQRRNCEALLDNLALGAYAWINDRPLDWGAGGPQRWPGARPYATPEGCQDQLGFRVFDWYLAVSQQELGLRLPVFLLRAGQRLSPGLSPEQAQAARIHHARQNLQAARWVAGGLDVESAVDPRPEEVRACNFWLLAAEPGSPQVDEAWFSPSGERLPAAEAFRQWTAHLRRPVDPARPVSCGDAEELLPAEREPVEASGAPSQEAPAAGSADDAGSANAGSVADSTADDAPSAGAPSAGEASHPDGTGLKPGSPATPIVHPINHYILLPLYAWGAANWDLALVETLMQDSHPAIGFSLAEARLAKRVTVVGAEGAVSGEALAMLRRSGCQVDRLLEDGTLIAT
jgi:hypothetical protein